MLTIEELKEMTGVSDEFAQKVLDRTENGKTETTDLTV